MTKWISLFEASALCDCSDLTVANALRNGKVNAYKEKRNGRDFWQIDEESLLAWNRDRLRERRMLRNKKCRCCGKMFKTFDKTDLFCSFDCEELYNQKQDKNKGKINEDYFTSYLTSGLTMAQQCRIIQDLFHPVTEAERIDAVSKWMKNSKLYYPEWLKEHSLGEISGKVVDVYANPKM